MSSIRFILADTFGDGWDSAQFFMYDYKGTYSTATSTCSHNVVTKKYCFDPQNTTIGATLNATVFGFLPDDPWEVCSMYVTAALVDPLDITSLLTCLYVCRYYGGQWWTTPSRVVMLMCTLARRRL